MQWLARSWVIIASTLLLLSSFIDGTHSIFCSCLQSLLETRTDAKNLTDENETITLLFGAFTTTLPSWSKGLQHLFSSQEFPQAQSLGEIKFLCPQTEHVTFNVFTGISCCEIKKVEVLTEKVSHWPVGKTVTWESMGKKEGLQCHIAVQVLALLLNNHVPLKMFYLLWASVPLSINRNNVANLLTWSST